MFDKSKGKYVKLAVIPLALLSAALIASPLSSNADGADAQFVAKAASGGNAEVRMGQLAVDRASSREVKDFGRRMVKDHSQAGKKLQMTAGKEGITVPSDMNEEDRSTYDNLSGLSGSAFDRAYAAEMVKDQQKDIADFEKEAKYGKYPAILEFAQEMLPTLREHLQLAEKMERAFSASGNM
jgi:putative membrane protein